MSLDALDDTSSSTFGNIGKRPAGNSKESIKDSQHSTIPKMVLVEILGSRMFYPSCLVGILAEEMIRKSNSKSADFNKENILKNGVVFGSNGSGGGSSAEDHEVEEIFNSSFNGLSNIFNATKKSDLGKNFSKFFKKIFKKFFVLCLIKILVPPLLRSCKKSFVGVRAARRSYEDACLSVLLNANTIRRIDNSFIMDSINCSTFGNIPISANLEEETRWNFFDYLRREYCYCKLCSNNSVNEGKWYFIKK